MGNILTRLRHIYTDNPEPSPTPEEMKILRRAKTFRYPTSFRSNIYTDNDSEEDDHIGPSVLVVPSSSQRKSCIDTGCQVGPPHGYRRQSHPLMRPSLLQTKIKSVAFKEMATSAAIPGAGVRQGSFRRPSRRGDQLLQDMPPKIRYRVSGAIAGPSGMPPAKRQKEMQRQDTGRFLQIPAPSPNKKRGTTPPPPPIKVDKDTEMIPENGAGTELLL